MSTIQEIPVDHIQGVWDSVKGYLEKGLSHSGGEYTVDQLKVFLTQGQSTLIVILDDSNKIKGALTVEWNNYPNARIAFMTAIGGATCQESFNMFCEWVKWRGGTAIRGAAFESVARLWKKKFGFENRYITVEKKL
tara:strand:- start:264 stop:671 length:408 start_codon:yes stop_codon:yes gene_type:complete